jgi:alanine racemase
MLESIGPASATVWLKVDTGMHRLGVAMSEADSYLKRLRASAAVDDVRLMTHLANADDTADPTTAEQIRRFATIAADFDGDISISNSAALLGPAEQYQMAIRDNPRVWVRPGIALYGISPFRNQTAAALGLEPVMQFESRLIAVKRIGKGDPVGYGGTWIADRDTTIGIVSAGYGDGYSRFLPSGTPILVGGRRVSLAGTISMDMLAVDLGPDAEDCPGDTVILWGDGLPAEEVAACAGTIAYQLICGITHREPGEVMANPTHAQD